jgi:hypothetical protein
MRWIVGYALSLRRFLSLGGEMMKRNQNHPAFNEKT